MILAEFVAAALIVALAPIARGKEGAGAAVGSAIAQGVQEATGGTAGPSGSSSGPSPYGPDDIKQLAGIGAVYFVLALLSSGKYGRLSAWFGGLVLVAIGLSETTSGGLAAIFGIFQPSSKSAGASNGAGAAVGGEIAQGTGEAIGNATGIFPVVTPGGQIIPAGVTRPTPTGSPTFVEQVTQASGGLATAYQGGPGVVTTDTGTQLA